MKENPAAPVEMSNNQRRIFIDAVQLYDTYMDAFWENRSYRGGMHWKKAKGREYLFRSRDRYGHGNSLGPRNPKTEKTLAEFRAGKEKAKARVSALKGRLKEQSRFCKAAVIQRVPRTVTGILRVLDQNRLLGRNVSIVGTNALYAYEAAAGVFVDSPFLATRDMDILWDIRSRLNLVAVDEQQGSGMLALLRKADRSFELVERQNFRAVNKDGYLVDLIKPEPRNVFKRERRRMGPPGDLEAAEIRNLQWLVSSPKFKQVVIGDDGYPAAMACPDPRAFALHKIWLSDQADRNPLKKKRDRQQALAVAYLVSRYLPHYRFTSPELRMFPKEVFTEAARVISDQEPPPAF